jgi:hypothetical protein
MQLVVHPPPEADAVPHPDPGEHAAPCEQLPPMMGGGDGSGTVVDGQVSTTHTPFWIA